MIATHDLRPWLVGHGDVAQQGEDQSEAQLGSLEICGSRQGIGFLVKQRTANKLSMSSEGRQDSCRIMKMGVCHQCRQFLQNVLQVQVKCWQAESRNVHKT